MIHNPVIDALMRRKSIRKYTDQMPGEDVIETLVRAGQQAPFAAQMGSLLLSRHAKKHPFGAPLLFTACADVHRLEVILEKRGWDRVSSDGAILLFALQDAAYMIQNLVIAAESLGLGSCYLGGAPFYAAKIVEDYALPPKVFPLVQLTVGYPAEEHPPRPRYPIGFSLFEDTYPTFEDDAIDQAMQVMDEGYLAQDYYRNANAKIALSEGRDETFTFDDYSWTEHMGRKWGQWLADPEQLMKPFRRCGFFVEPEDTKS